MLNYIKLFFLKLLPSLKCLLKIDKKKKRKSGKVSSKYAFKLEIERAPKKAN
jgi:hypothetical protein